LYSVKQKFHTENEKTQESWIWARAPKKCAPCFRGIHGISCLFSFSNDDVWFLGLDFIQLKIDFSSKREWWQLYHVSNLNQLVISTLFSAWWWRRRFFETLRKIWIKRWANTELKINFSYEFTYESAYKISYGKEVKWTSKSQKIHVLRLSKIRT
jgi:hypothetical protein